MLILLASSHVGASSPSLTEWLTNQFNFHKPSEYEIQLRKWIKYSEKSGTPLNIKEIGDFDWDRLFIFGPYASNDWVSEELGFEWTGINFYKEVSEGVCYLLFVKENAVVHYVKYPRSWGDFSRAYKQGGYGHQDAIFYVKKGGGPFFFREPPLILTHPVEE